MRELRDLVERYAEGVDRREFDEVAALFRPDAVLRIPGRRLTELDEHAGTAAIAAALRGVERTVATMHAITGQTISLDGTTATGSVSCLAHHLVDTGEGRGSHVWVVRYADRYVFTDESWWFASRELQVRWIESHEVIWSAAPSV